VSRAPIFRTLLRKELTETLRDRRTLLMMLGVPLILYPAILVLTGQLMTAGQWRLAQTEVRVALVGEAARALFSESALERVEFVPLPEVQARQRLQARTLELAVVPREDGPGFVLLYSQRQDLSMEARRRVEQELDHVRQRLLKSKLADLKLEPRALEVLPVKSVDIDAAGGLGALLAARLLPMLLVMMLFLGAFYTAIDVTAGEKERGTLETLLVAPVTPFQVMASKWVTVFTVCLAATLLNLASLGLTLAFGIQGAPDETRMQLSLSLSQVCVMGLALLPSAALVSALSLAVATLARTYREGQHLLTPLLMVGLVPPILALMPGLELALWNAWIPLLNLALLIKAVALGTVQWSAVAWVLVSAAVLALGALRLAAVAFESEALRFGGLESWGELLGRGRSK